MPIFNTILQFKHLKIIRSYNAISLYFSNTYVIESIDISDELIYHLDITTRFELYDNSDLENNSVLISEKYELQIMECLGYLERILLYQRILRPLFSNTFFKEITHICSVCNKYKKSNNAKSICCKKRLITASFSLHKKKRSIISK
ncbi:hypothetical protein H8356DRAFT_1342713 [Neocallimastix lanati (nom. inval.)]|nr:hypothetical protein H8356DRAFT_1342713 [Neocallimastix sp. JGI-2020a]